MSRKLAPALLAMLLSACSSFDLKYEDEDGVLSVHSENQVCPKQSGTNTNVNQNGVAKCKIIDPKDL